MIDQIRHNAKLVRSVAHDQLNIDVGFDHDAVKWLDGFITRQYEQGDPNNIERLVSTLGSFLGKCQLPCRGRFLTIEEIRQRVDPHVLEFWASLQ